MDLPRLPAATGAPDASGSRVSAVISSVDNSKTSVPSSVGSGPAHAQTNANRAASAQVLAALLGRNAVTTLAQNPAAGSTIDARVDAALGDDLYLVTVSGSGQQLVARSAVTLTPQSVLSARVALVDGTVVLQRLEVSDSLRTDGLAAVRAQLTAAGAVGQAVLDAFEHAGAPLDDARLAAAVDDLIELIDRSAEPRTLSRGTSSRPASVDVRATISASRADTTAARPADVPTADINSTIKTALFVQPASIPMSPVHTATPASGTARAQADAVSTAANASTTKLGPTIREAAGLLPRGALRELADAHAALAVRALPATPTLVALALRALDGRLPNLAATLPAANPAAAPALTLTAAAEREPNNAPALSGVATAAALPAASAPSAHSRGEMATSAAHTPASAPTSLPLDADAPPAAAANAAVGAGATTASARLSPDAANQATATSERFPSAARANPAPTAAGNANAPAPTKAGSGITLTRDPTVAAAALGAPPSRALVPDLRDGSAAVLRALALSGLRERGDTRIAEPTLLRVIASHSTSGLAAVTANPGTTQRVPEGASARHGTAAERSAPAVPDALAADTRTATAAVTSAADSAREGLAQTLIRPQELAEYDTVLAVPLTGHGQPLPARISVTSRPAGHGPAATWVRVDTELSHLGAVSVRLSGLEGGPLAITIIAGARGVGPLAGVLPELATALEQLGVQAAVRVAQAEPA